MINDIVPYAYLLCLGKLGSLMRIKCVLIIITIYVSLVKFIYDTIHTYTIYSPSIMYLVVGPFFEHIRYVLYIHIRIIRITYIQKHMHTYTKPKYKNEKNFGILLKRFAYKKWCFNQLLR